MISVNNLSIHFSGIYLFNNVTFNINGRDRIGLVGKNGAGKSTLLKIISGTQEPESGSVNIAEGKTIGYLPQEMVPNAGNTVVNEALQAFEEINFLEKEQENLTHQVTERTDYESDAYMHLLNRLHEITERLQVIGVTSKQEEAEKVLLGLGFKHSDFTRSIAEFSTGWQMRVELARILLKKPDYVLLDEPTNHLDIESIQWLETFLINYFGAVILVSHDRTFLDNITKRTIEITAGKIYDHKASYSEYVKLFEERIQTQIATLSNQQKEIVEIERFIERFRYTATKAKQVQSRVKMLEKMDKVEVDEYDKASIRFKFPPAPHSGKIVAEINELSKRYPQKEVLKDINLYIERGQRIAFIGRNGEGKSTLSKIIVGEIEDYTGEYKKGHQVSLGYFAQNQAALLNGEKTVFETIDDIAEGEIRTKIRNILGGFLFGGDDIDKKVKVLSGGEKTRLALAKLLLTPSNLLVLDEPTNHLDMDSKDVLKNALLQYTGTLIIVSHDRDFLTGLTDNIFEFKDKQIKEFKGDIFEFLENRKIENLQALEVAKKGKETVVQQVPGNKADYEKNKESEKELRKLKNKVNSLELKIQELETKIQEQEKLLHNNPQIMVEDVSYYQNYENLKKQLDATMQEWEQESLKLEQMA